MKHKEQSEYVDRTQRQYETALTSAIKIYTSKKTLHVLTSLFMPRFVFIVYYVNTRSSAIAEGPRDASCQWKSGQLPRNSAETTYATSPDQVDGMKLEI